MKIYSFLRTTNKEVRSERKDIIVRALKSEQKSFINELVSKLDDLSLAKMDLENIRVDNIVPAEWVKEYNKITLEMDITKEELKTAKKIYKDLFKTSEDEDISKSMIDGEE